MAAPIPAKARLNCFIRKLKSEHKLDATFPEFDAGGETEDCDAFIKEAEKEVYHQVALGVRKKTDFGDYTKCIMADLRSHNWVDDMWLSFIYGASDTLSETEKSAKMQEYDDKIEKSATEAFTACVFEEEFGELFDDLVKKGGSSSSEEDLEDQVQAYCARKLVVGRHLMKAEYNLEVNPKNINVDGVNCKTVTLPMIKEMRKMLIDTLNEDDLSLDKKQIKCIENKFKEESFIGKFFAIALLNEVKLTDEQKAEERRSFINYMVEMITTIETCSEE